jgi:hypothetical protein
MSTRQRESGRVVIECGRLPRRGRMACLATLTKAAGHMIWVLSSLIIGRVALIAVGIRQLVVSVRMTCLTCDGNMCARQRELRRVMVKRRRYPRRGGMTGLTGLTKSAGHVIRVFGPLEIGRVALVAVRIR